MNRKQKGILLVAALVLILMILFPPYYGIDRESGGRVHAFVGYHAIWNPPSASYVYERLAFLDPESADPGRLSSFEARLNAVRMIFNCAILGIATALAMFVLRKQPKGA